MATTEPPAGGDDSAFTNVRLLVAYDGTGFRGLAPNVGVRTVVGELQRVIEPLIGHVPEIVMSGRTDAGVHARGQVLSFRAAHTAVDLDRLQKSVNSRLGPEIVVREASEVADDFSARFSATGRSYRYHLHNQSVPDPFSARTAWWVDRQLDIGAMSSACPHLIGEHDFSSFCRQPKPRPAPDGAIERPSMVRRVTEARWLRVPEESAESVGDAPSATGHLGPLRFDIAGSAFCHQMVRSIVGFMVAVGAGKRTADELPSVLAARDRSAAEQPAPPHGLTLWAVDYEA